MTKTEMIDILRGKKLLKAPENDDELLEGLKMLDTIFDEIADELEQSKRVVHGWWIETIENGKMKRVTSCCGDNQTTLTCWYTPSYCPNCGAIMDGGIKCEF